MVLTEPLAQRGVGAVRPVSAGRRSRNAEQLFSYGIGGLKHVFGRVDIALKTYPAVAIAIDQKSSKHSRVIGSRGMPEPSIEDNGVARLSADRHRALGLTDAVRGQFDRFLQVALPGTTQRLPLPDSEASERKYPTLSDSLAGKSSSGMSDVARPESW